MANNKYHSEIVKEIAKKTGKPMKEVSEIIDAFLCGISDTLNENTIVTSLVSKDQVQASEIDELVEKKFEGSLPAFIAAFTKHQNMTEKEIDEVQKMIDQIRKGGK